MAILLNTGGSCSYLYPSYNETLRGCFTVGGKKKYQKIDDNGELVIEWKKEKSIKYVVVENICYD